jgi:hypothetical protein
MHTHIMLDLETLDTRTSAVVLSIGAVAFDPHSHSPLGERFYLELTDDIWQQQQLNRTISGDTVRWWIAQSPEAQKVLGKDDPNRVRATTIEALMQFSAYIDRNGGPDAKIWGNGADFDNILLGSLYADFGLARPWSYGRNRCYRTVKNLGFGPRRPAREGVHHNALDDAITQAVHLQEIFACLPSR